MQWVGLVKFLWSGIINLISYIYFSASRVQTALTTRKVTQSMAGVVKAMDAAMKSMNLEKISGLMDKFETQFEDLDVQSNVMENTMSSTVTTSIPQGDVDSLMQRVADEAG